MCEPIGELKEMANKLSGGFIFVTPNLHTKKVESSLKSPSSKTCQRRYFSPFINMIPTLLTNKNSVPSGSSLVACNE